ncbi:MAG TPA: carboxypeptidase-like regulatory domain-containing protein, partial [Hanamia sp.]|nr:carboxypeptidase-like regulatory domain-containing protein [Hanamia sp.]
MEKKLPRGYSRRLVCFFTNLFGSKQIVILFFMQLCFVGAFAQHTVTGTVHDSKGEVLQGVSITVKGSQVGAATNTKGHYSINAPDQNASLVFSYVG